MKRLTCPLNGPRNISEFTYGGEFHPQPDDAVVTREEWAEYIFFRDNKAGVVLEWWCHTASSFWFLAERNTVTDQILHTLTFAELKQQQGSA